jgi:hypothetical protein
LAIRPGEEKKGYVEEKKAATEQAKEAKGQHWMPFIG